MTSFPPIQIVDDNDEPIGGASMAEAYQKGLKHRVVIIFVEDEGGRILLQKRSPNVAVYANCWDVSAAGHVDEGEDYLTAAKRELAEELGLSQVELEPLESMYAETYFEDGRQAKRFRNIFRTRIDSKTKLTPSPEEISEIRWASVEEIHALIKDHSQEVHADLGGLIERLYAVWRSQG